MERNFTLPIAFAAALHGALLFGFNAEARPAAPKPTTMIRSFPLPPAPPPPEDEPRVVEEAGEAAKPRTEPDVPTLPQSAEPPAVVSDTMFTIKPPVTEVSAKEIETLFRIPTDVRRGDGKGAFDGDIIGSGFLDNTPRTRFQVPPPYPYEAKTQGLRGEVIVEFIVDESGAVIDPRVVQSTHRVFDEPSLRAVAKWKFEPGRKNGQVVRFRMSVPVVFNLNE